MSAKWIECGKEVLSIEMEALAYARERLGPEFAAAVELLAGCAGRVAITGIGKSGLVGRKIAATLSSTGTPSYFLHPVEGAHGDLGAVRDGDVIIAISHSGRTEELNAILPALRDLGARVIAITSGLQSPLAALSDVVIDGAVPREACPMNLAPTSSTTAALAIGDALAVCLIHAKSFTASDFRRYHPGGALGRHLCLSAANIMRTDDLPLIEDSSTFDAALKVLDKGGYGTVLLTDGMKRLTGILTDGDVRRLLCRGMPDGDRTAAAVMTRAPLHAQAGMSAAELVDMMEEKAITVLPVLHDDGVVAGIVHLHDLLGKGRIQFSGIRFAENAW
jgi:arabinose-5-phosphate isomerase